MSKWFRLKHRATGEEQNVRSLDGYALDEFDVAELAREPEEDDDFDWRARKLVTNAAKKAQRDRALKVSRTSQAEIVERLERIEAQLEGRGAA